MRPSFVPRLTGSGWLCAGPRLEVPGLLTGVSVSLSSIRSPSKQTNLSTNDSGGGGSLFVLREVAFFPFQNMLLSVKYQKV